MNLDANVQKILFALIRKWKLLVIFAIIGGLLGYVYTANFTRLTYTSSVTFLASAVDSKQEISDDSNISSSNNQANTPENVRSSNTSKMNYAMKMLPTYIRIMQTNEFNNKVAEELNKRINSSYGGGTIKGSTSIESVEDTAIFVMTVVTGDPNLSYEIARQLEISVPEMMEETNSGLVKADVKDKAVKNTAAGSLGYPKKCAIGAIAGLFVAAAYVVLRSLLDVRIKTEEELIEKYNIPVLGSIPNFEAKTASSSSSSKKKGADK